MIWKNHKLPPEPRKEVLLVGNLQNPILEEEETEAVEDILNPETGALIAIVCLMKKNWNKKSYKTQIAKRICNCIVYTKEKKRKREWIDEWNGFGDWGLFCGGG